MHLSARSSTSHSKSDKLPERVLSCNTEEGLRFLPDIWPDDYDKQPNPQYQTNHTLATRVHRRVTCHLQKVRERLNGAIF